MKSIIVFLLCFILASSQTAFAEKGELKTRKEKESYSLGWDIGSTLKRQEIDVSLEELYRGMKDALTGNRPIMSEQDMRDSIIALSERVTAKRQEKMKALAEKNRKEGEAFLAKNRKEKDVKTLPSGLQYKILKEGDGASPKITDMVTVNYKGMLIDGTEFDSSYRRGAPATFPVNGVIKGWTEALQLMKEGSKWQLFIPSELAYGEKGSAPVIGPNSVLIFEVELISVKKAEEKGGK